jgi:transcription antitermination factor NusG
MVQYLPLMKKSRRYGKRVRVYEHPVFAGYLFVLTHTAGRALIRQYQRVANVLDVADQQTLVAQLHQIKTALDQNEAFELFPHLTAGTRVKVQAGPLKGVEGFVVRLKNKTRIVLNIDFIQQALAVEVEAEWLLPM